MFGFFRKGTLLGEELTEWQFDVFAWLLRHTGGFETLQRGKLILPTPAFFPQKVAREEGFAEAMFEQVRQHAGMADWPCTLQVQDEAPDPLVAPTLLVRGTPNSPAGTFRRTAEGALITYRAGQARDPAALVATFAHELGTIALRTFRSSRRAAGRYGGRLPTWRRYFSVSGCFWPIPLSSFRSTRIVRASDGVPSGRVTCQSQNCCTCMPFWPA